MSCDIILTTIFVKFKFIYVFILDSACYNQSTQTACQIANVANHILIVVEGLKVATLSSYCRGNIDNPFVYTQSILLTAPPDLPDPSPSIIGEYQYSNRKSISCYENNSKYPLFLTDA